MADHDPQVMGVFDMGRTPDILEQLLLGHYPSEMACQRGEHRILLARQRHFRTLQGDSAIGEVHLQRADRHRRLRAFALRRLAQQDAHAGEELLDAERLGHVVVGAAIQGQYLLALAGAHRQHQHRHLRPFAQVAKDVLAVAVRQAEVEHHQVRPVQRGLGQPLFAGAGLEHPVALGIEADTEELADLRFVVDQQDAVLQLGHGTRHGR
ncbi:Uncharacterised protein [Klebsiella pneumoniae]|nr:Uncharacterised protein [Klebsiella pneumoniae]